MTTSLQAKLDIQYRHPEAPESESNKVICKPFGAMNIDHTIVEATRLFRSERARIEREGGTIVHASVHIAQIFWVFTRDDVSPRHSA